MNGLRAKGNTKMFPSENKNKMLRSVESSANLSFLIFTRLTLRNLRKVLWQYCHQVLVLAPLMKTVVLWNQVKGFLPLTSSVVVVVFIIYLLPSGV